MNKPKGSFASTETAPEESAIIDTVRTAVINVEGNERHITYDLQRLTPKLRKQLASLNQAGSAEEASEEAMIGFVARVVSAWDLIDDEGQPIPVSKAGVSEISYRTLADIAEAINGGGPNGAGAKTQTADSPA